MFDSRRRWLMLVALCLAAGGARAGGTELASLGDLKARYSRIKTIHLIAHAQAWVAFDKDPPVSGVLSFEYWADRGRYLVRCYSDPALGLVHDMEIAFDGTYSQLLNVADSTLNFQRGESLQMPVACPNPLFLPLGFLNPDRDDCAVCGTRLQDLSDESRWSRLKPRALEFASAESEPAFEMESETGGINRSYQVRLGRFSGSTVPSSLKRLDSNGRLDMEVVVDGFQTVDTSVGPIPIRMSARSFDNSDNGRIDSSVTWKIDVLEVNVGVGDAVFTLDASTVKAVWDSDAEVFLKHPDDRAVGRGLDHQR